MTFPSIFAHPLTPLGLLDFGGLAAEGASLDVVADLLEGLGKLFDFVSSDACEDLLAG
jgi:hypothetical protein